MQERNEKEHAEEIAVREAAEQKEIAEAVEAGGVTEEQAVGIAEQYLQKIYGVDDSGMELSHYYDVDAADIIVGQPAYCVNWSDIINHRFYYFWISIADGRLLRMDYSGDQVREQLESVRPAIEEAPDTIAQVKAEAERFLTDNMGVQESYVRVRSCYQTTSEGGVSTLVDVLFVKADGAAHLLECSWDGNVKGYSFVTEKDYEGSIEKSREVKSMRYTEEYGREVTVDNVWD